MPFLPVKIFPIIQVVADFLILALLLYYFIKRKEDRQRDRILEVRAKEMLNLNRSMDSLIKDAQRVTEEWINSTESKQSEMKSLLKALDEKKEQVLKALAEQPRDLPVPAPKVEEMEKADNVPHIEEQEEDKYTQAARLAEEGYPPDEIARMVNLSRGEVELILDLKK
jgi:hypothetical protein